MQYQLWLKLHHPDPGAIKTIDNWVGALLGDAWRRIKNQLEFLTLFKRYMAPKCKCDLASQTTAVDSRLARATHEMCAFIINGFSWSRAASLI